MKQDLTRRALLVGTGATVIGAAVAAAAQTHETSTDHKAQRVARRHALVVDANSCSRGSECRACIDACHEAHSVPNLSDPRHEVKWVWKAPFAGVFPEQIHPLTPPEQRQLPVLVTCNHCSSPPCTRVCPTRATWKRADGIVAMDPHRCIGCRYCMAACPYGARSFNWEEPPKLQQPRPYPQRGAGVVEKCTLCAERIDAGQAPVCVEACMNTGRGALSFGDLTNPDSHVARLLATRQVLRRKPELGTQPNVYYLV
jgi:Fe-S-cluster-containing dehydrogenase component